MFAITTDIRGWKRLNMQVKLYTTAKISELVKQASQDVFEKARANLTGPHYRVGERGPQTGKMPIPRITSMLARSLRILTQAFNFHVIYSDPVIAPYAATVHNGAKIKIKGKIVGFRKARRFLGDPVNQLRLKWLAIWKKDFLTGLMRLR